MTIRDYAYHVLDYVRSNHPHPDIVEGYMSQVYGAIDFYSRATGDKEIFGWWENEIQPAFEKLIYNF